MLLLPGRRAENAVKSFDSTITPSLRVGFEIEFYFQIGFGSPFVRLNQSMT
jgi:hypothetical protein